VERVLWGWLLGIGAGYSARCPITCPINWRFHLQYTDCANFSHDRLQFIGNLVRLVRIAHAVGCIPVRAGRASGTLSGTRRSGALQQPPGVVQQSLPIPQQPLSIAKQPPGVVRQSLPISHQPAGVPEQPLATVEQPPPLARQPLGVLEQPPSIGQQPPGVPQQPPPTVQQPPGIPKQPPPIGLQPPRCPSRSIRTGKRAERDHQDCPRRSVRNHYRLPGNQWRFPRTLHRQVDSPGRCPDNPARPSTHPAEYPPLDPIPHPNPRKPLPQLPHPPCPIDPSAVDRHRIRQRHPRHDACPQIRLLTGHQIPVGHIPAREALGVDPVVIPRVVVAQHQPDFAVGVDGRAARGVADRAIQVIHAVEERARVWRCRDDFASGSTRRNRRRKPEGTRRPLCGTSPAWAARCTRRAIVLRAAAGESCAM